LYENTFNKIERNHRVEDSIANELDHVEKISAAHVKLERENKTPDSCVKSTERGKYRSIGAEL